MRGAQRFRAARRKVLISLATLPTTGNGLWTWKGFHLGDVLGIHGFGTAEPRFVRRAECVGQLGVLARQEALAWQGVRHGASLDHGFRRLLARVGRELKFGVKHPEEGGPDI